MPTAVSLTIAAGSPNARRQAPASSVDLRAQLDRYQKQLSDCVNCASAKTPKGKADIAAISAKIDQVKRAMAPSSDDAGASASSAQSAPQSPGQATASPSNLGTYVDTFA